MKKKILYGVFVLLSFLAEAGYRWNFLKEIVPFPWAEFWYHTLNYFFRDLLAAGGKYTADSLLRQAT